MRRRSDGFTLIEVLVVLMLLGVIMGVSAGWIQRAGTGNLLIQTTNSLSSLLASARAQSFGNETAYVLVEADERGGTTFRAFRDRQVFFWACEDFERASEIGVISKTGAVEVATGGTGGGEGRFVSFNGGTVSLGNQPWLQLVDGVSLRCRIRPDSSSSLASMTLFEKGTCIQVKLVLGSSGRFDVEATLKLRADRDGEGGGACALRTGFRGPEEVSEWRAPVLPGRWQELQVTYDRNTFSIQLDGRLRGIRTDRRNAMVPELERPFVIGTNYRGGFDSLLIGGIFEDDDDRFDVPPQVIWIDPANAVIKGRQAFVHFRNRGLDPRQHPKAVDLQFMLERVGEAVGPRRIVSVAMSGETFVRRPEE